MNILGLQCGYNGSVCVVVDGNIVTSPHYKYVGEWMKGAIELLKKNYKVLK